MDFASKMILAPMASITDTIFRTICKQMGADIVVSEMASAEGIVRNGAGTRALMRFSEFERPIGIQLFGSHPERLAYGASYVEENIRPDFIDLNCGCPARKVVRKNGGASLLKDRVLFEKMLRAMVRAVSLPVTVKIRSGWHKHEWVDVLYAQIAEQCGAAAITVHPRSVTMGLSGHSFWERIAAVKAAVRIPVIGNGDVVEPADAGNMMKQTGCDSVMIGRAAWGNPWIFSQCKSLLAGTVPAVVTAEMRLKTAVDHIDSYVKTYGEKRAAREMKKHVARYLKGLPGASSMRDTIFLSSHTAQMRATLRAYLAKLVNAGSNSKAQNNNEPQFRQTHVHQTNLD